MPKDKMAVGIAVLAITGGSVWAEAPRSSKLTTKTDRVVVFKDGYALFDKSATGTLDGSGLIDLADVPAAISLGSFWALPESGTLRNIVAKRWIELEGGRQEPKSSLLFQFDAASVPEGKVNMALQYFRAGLRWIPTYRVALGKQDATLYMQAEILNEAEDLDGVDLRLVVGTPNFQFKDVPSPLTFEGSVSNPLSAVAPALMAQQQANVAGPAQFREIEDTRGIGTGDWNWSPPELAGEAMQNLYLYEVPNFTLATGERAIVPVISAHVPLKHIYTWEANIVHAAQEAQQPEARELAMREGRGQVWHVIDLTNQSDRPWTTGPAFFSDGLLPVAQGLLKYTPVQGTCRVPLTLAPDVAHSVAEEETEREHNAGSINGRNFTRIGKRGYLRVTNHKQASIQLEVRCEIAGNATWASDEVDPVRGDYRASDWRDFSGTPAMNGHSTMTWNLTLDPGSSKELIFEYEYFVWQ